MKFQQVIFALSRIIQVLISLEYTLFNIIPKSLVTLQFLKFLIFQTKAYIQGFQMRYQSFLGHWYPNSYSWFSDSIDIPFVLITTVFMKISQPYLLFYYWTNETSFTKMSTLFQGQCTVYSIFLTYIVLTNTTKVENLNRLSFGADKNWSKW